MERVVGIGGLFFRARDSAKLARWYADHLGVDPVPTEYGQRSWRQEAGATVFTALPDDAPNFGGPEHSWAVNFRVRDLDAMVTQLRTAGIEVVVDPESYPIGRFADLHDPEGNGVQLWQPEGPDLD